MIRSGRLSTFTTGQRSIWNGTIPMRSRQRTEISKLLSLKNPTTISTSGPECFSREYTCGMFRVWAILTHRRCRWNKFCFTGGYIEVNLSLPGTPTAQGYWPGVWTMGNLGRPGFGGSVDGMWPYSYNGCDSGTLRKSGLTSIPGFGTDFSSFVLS